MSGAILVTGGAGALGRRVGARLRSAGMEVVSASRESADRVLDVTDAASVADLVASLRPTAVVHLASALPGADDETLERVNVGGTAAVAAACARTGSRLVFASSSAVYGVSNDRASREDDTLAPANPYGVSKVRAEQTVEAWGEELTAISARIFNVTGPGFPAALPSRLLDSTPESPLPLRNPDAFVRDYVRVDDVVEALVAALGAPVAAGHTALNVGSGVPTSSTRLVELLEVQAARVQRVPGPEDRVWADVSRLRSLLGFVPEGIQARWFGPV